MKIGPNWPLTYFSLTADYSKVPHEFTFKNEITTGLLLHNFISMYPHECCHDTLGGNFYGLLTVVVENLFE